MRDIKKSEIIQNVFFWNRYYMYITTWDSSLMLLKSKESFENRDMLNSCFYVHVCSFNIYPFVNMEIVFILTYEKTINNQHDYDISQFLVRI